LPAYCGGLAEDLDGALPGH